MLNKTSIAPIGEAGGKTPHQSETPINLAQQQSPGVRRDLPATKIGNHRTTFNESEFARRLPARRLG
jgi:hypothetical protein